MIDLLPGAHSHSVSQRNLRPEASLLPARLSTVVKSLSPSQDGQQQQREEQQQRQRQQQWKEQ